MTEHRRRPTGFSLVELMTTIAVLTILLGMCAGLIRILLKLDHAGRDAMDVENDQVRLARTLRDEAHRSTSPTPRLIQADRLTLILPDNQTVEYTVRPHDLLREVRQGEKVRQRELYRTPPRATVRFEAATEAGRSVVSLLVSPSNRGLDSVIRVDAEVGRLARLIARKP